MRLKRNSVFTVLTAALLAWGGLSGVAHATTLNVAVNTTQVDNSNFGGFGGNWGPQGFFSGSGMTAADWTTETDRVAYMNMKVFRLFFGFNYFLTGTSAYDTPNYSTTKMNSLYKYLDYAQANNLDVILTASYKDSKFSDLTSYSDPQWATVYGNLLDELINTKGYTCIKYVTLVNEPDWNKESEANYETGLQNLYSTLGTLGLRSQVKLIGPDSTNNGEWLQATVDDEKSILGGYAGHFYSTSSIKSDVANKVSYIATNDSSSKPYFMDEMNYGAAHTNPSSHGKGVGLVWQASNAVQGGAAAVMIWKISDNDFWTGTTGTGLWAAKVNDANMSLRPAFYTWSLLSRYVPKGSTIYDVTTGDSSVNVIASKKSGAWTFALANTDKTAPRTINLSVSGSSTVQNFYEYDYVNTSADPTDYSVYNQDANGYPVPVTTLSSVDLGTGTTVTVPANAVVFLTPVDGGAGGGPLFSDDFEDGSASDWGVTSGTWSVVADGTEMYKNSNSSGNGSTKNGSASWTDYTVQADVKPLTFAGGSSGNSVGIQARYQDDNNKYNFVYSDHAGELQITKKVGGTKTVLASTSYTLSTGTTYTFKGVLSGSTLKFYVNGVLQLTATDTSFSSGKFGLTTYNASSEFDNVSVTN